MNIAERFTQSLDARRKNKGHNVVGIQGEPGSGKSTLGVTIALVLEDGDFSTRNVYYDMQGCLDIAKAPKGGVFLLDEGSKIAMNRTWQNRDQVQLMQLLNTIRQRHHTLIWATPNLKRLDVILREDLLSHRVNVIKRGLARVRTPHLDRDGEPNGWKTWHGYLTWASLDKHKFWPGYMKAKERSYAETVRKMLHQKKKSVQEEIEELEADLEA